MERQDSSSLHLENGDGRHGGDHVTHLDWKSLIINTRET